MVIFKRILCIALLLAIGLFNQEALASSDGKLGCQAEVAKNLISCDFETKNLSKPSSIAVRVDGKPVNGIKFDDYPANDQKSAILFLVDISDPTRAMTVARNVDAIRKILKKQNSRQKFGIATFDSQFRVLAPVGSSAVDLDRALSRLRAGGAATEFYKNIMAGTRTLSAYPADRKALVLFSDGKAEDRAYGRGDALKAMEKAGVVLIGLGYAETPGDAPALQTIERLAAESGGSFTAASPSRLLPSSFYASPFNAIENGGRFTFDAGRAFGLTGVEVDVFNQKKKVQTLSTEFNANQGRGFWKNVLAFLTSYWLALLGAVVGLALLTAAYIWRRRRLAAAIVPTLEFGFLEEVDGRGTIHSLTRSALRIGRSDESDIQLFNGSVSRNHAELHRREDGWYIVDLASTNGVRVNDQPVTSAVIKNGDLLEIGEVRFRFVEYQDL